MEDRLRIEFNEWARAGRGESMERGHRPAGEQAIEKMAVAADARVLDVGCGSGWASRLLAEKASEGRVVGIDISDEMIDLAIATSSQFANLQFKVASVEALPFADNEFSEAFSMESLYYYDNILSALKEIRRVLEPGGRFTTVIDLYEENEPSHQWIDKLKVPVHLLSIPQYHSLFEQAGFVDVQDDRIRDPAPDLSYSGTSFKSREDYSLYKANGSLMLGAQVER